MPHPPTIFYAGGGTGGHIYPNLAIHEALRQIKPQATAHFLVSNRAVDARIMAADGTPFTPLPAQPLAMKPLGLLRFFKGFRAARRQCRRLIRDHKPLAMVATGGFVSAPAVAAANDEKLAVLMVNLDAVPGKANQWIAKRATELFTAYPHPLLETATVVGLPLRQSALGPADQRVARAQLGLDPDRPVLLVTGASQGATSINQLMLELAKLSSSNQALRSWQVYHLAGQQDAPAVAKAYADAKLDAKVEAFSHQMGLAWRAATIAISRCGAGSVAEVWANAVPTIFLPYPYHKDQHQKLNARMLVEAGAAVMLDDLVDPLANARQITGPLLDLMRNEARRLRMIDLMQTDRPEPGAEAIAKWLARLV